MASLLLGGAWWIRDGGSGTAASDAPQAGASEAARPRASAPPAPLPRSPAVSLTIPHIGVKAAPVVPLGLDRQRRLTTPPVDDPETAGWYRDGPSPGERGTAVLVGHLDTRSGPAVFAGVAELGLGHTIEVRRADGRTAVYKVHAVHTYPKDRFPTAKVYGPRDRPELRLLTCAGTYAPGAGYDSNTVVFAHLAAARAPAAGTHAAPPRS